MTHITIRLSSELKCEMDEHEEFNWSAFIRNRIKQEVDHSNASKKVKQFVHKDIINDDHRAELAWALHLLITKPEDQHQKTTASRLFQEAELDHPLTEIKSKLANAGLDDLDQDVGRDLTVKQAFEEELADSGFIKEIPTRLEVPYVHH